MVSSTAASWSRRSKTSSSSATSPPVGSGTPIVPTCSRLTTATRRPLAPIYEMDAGLRRLTEETYRERGGKGEAIPGMGAQAGRGRVDLRFAVDNDGELYILTKSDGMIRKVVGAKTATTPTSAANVPAPGPGQNVTSQPATNARNPVASTPESIAAGKRAYDANCAACHGDLAQGAVKAGMTISIIEEQRGKQPPDLTDDQWDHGSSDGDVFAVIKRGLPPTHDGRIRWTHSGPGHLEHRQLPSHPARKKVGRAMPLRTIRAVWHVLGQVSSDGKATPGTCAPTSSAAVSKARCCD